MQDPNGSADEAGPAPVARVAVLDHDGVFWPPLEERLPESVKPGDVVFGDPALRALLPEGAVYVDTGCDLQGGKYKWNAALKRFDPLPREQRKVAPEAPTLEQALYDYLMTIGAAALPTRTAAWCDWFRRTLDERGRNKGGR